jgi:hypothetical protein
MASSMEDSMDVNPSMGSSMEDLQRGIFLLEFATFRPKSAKVGR